MGFLQQEHTARLVRNDGLSRESLRILASCGETFFFWQYDAGSECFKSTSWNIMCVTVGGSITI